MNVFVIGAQRSGTTLIRLVLNAHHRIAIPEEGTFWMPLLRRHSSPETRRIPQKTLRQYISYLQQNDQLAAWKIDTAEAFDPLLEKADVPLRDVMSAAYEAFGRDMGKDIVGDKTPSFFRMVPALAMHFPDAKFIHVVRDGRDAYLSLRRREPGRKNPAVGALEWTFKVRRAEKDLSVLDGSRVLQVRYEDFVEQPEHEARRMADFLDLPFDEQMLQFWKTSEKHIDKRHSRLIFKPVVKDATGKWHAEMSLWQAKVFQFFSDSVLRKHGYDRIQSGYSPVRTGFLAVPLLMAGLPLRMFYLVKARLLMAYAATFGRRTTASGGTFYTQTQALLVSPLGYTGLAYYDFSLAESLQRRGWNTELCTSDEWILKARDRSFRVDLLFKYCSGDRSRIVKGINYVFSLVRLLRKVLKHNIRLVHFQIMELAPVDALCMVALKMLGRHVVFTPHDVMHGTEGTIGTFMRTMYDASDAIIVHNDTNKKDLTEAYGHAEKVHVIPHGGYEFFLEGYRSKGDARRHLNLPPDGMLISFLGNVKFEKGIDVFLRSIAEVLRIHPGAHFLVAGKMSRGVTETWLRNVIKEENLDDRLILRLSFIPDEQILHYYNASDLVVLPYREISESGVLRFSQSLGIPAICSDIPEFRSEIEHRNTGFLFSNEDPASLAAIMSEVHDSADLPEISEKIRKRANDLYGWTSIAAQTESVYMDLVT